MPCYDPRDSEPQVRIVDNCPALKAVLCAVFNELDRRGILSEVAQEASRKGRIDVMSFYEDHKKEDKARLLADLHAKYSVDELALIKTLLK